MTSSLDAFPYTGSRPMEDMSCSRLVIGTRLLHKVLRYPISSRREGCDSDCQWRRKELKSGWRGTHPAPSAGKFLLLSPTLFGSTSTISRFGERFSNQIKSFIFRQHGP